MPVEDSVADERSSVADSDCPLAEPSDCWQRQRPVAAAVGVQPAERSYAPAGCHGPWVLQPFLLSWPPSAPLVVAPAWDSSTFPSLP